MKIYHLIILAALILFSQQTKAQDGSPSPYSFFGLGDVSFKGTAENMSMGGIQTYTDSIHYNINNPATLAQLKFVNLNLGLSNNFMYISGQNKSQWFSTHNMSYFSLAFPIGKKIGFGMGLLPINSSGFQVYNKTDLGTYTFKGDGGNSRLFLAAAYQLTKNLSLGGEYQYYFGFLEHEDYWIPTSAYTYTKENDYIDFTGSTFKASVFYKKPLKNNYYLNASANYRLASPFKANYKSRTRLITPQTGGEETVATYTNADTNGTIDFPSKLDMGVGFGQKNSWFIGADYSIQDKQNFRNPFFDPTYVKYTNASAFKLGGLYIPAYNSVAKYWKRITYRAGAYYKNTGMTIYDQNISNFGITFGLGLPAIRGISNLNLGLELGQRGKITDRLVKEQYINLHIGISLNDRWFIKRKIN